MSGGHSNRPGTSLWGRASKAYGRLPRSAAFKLRLSHLWIMSLKFFNRNGFLVLSLQMRLKGCFSLRVMLPVSTYLKVKLVARIDTCDL